MLSKFSGLPDYMLMALDRHKSLLEEARKERERCLVRRMGLEQPLRWRRVLHQMRNRVGDLLVHCGQKLKTDTNKTVWG